MKAVGILNGSGGMALGFEQAGFTIEGVIEGWDYGAAYRLNRPDIPHAISDPEAWNELAEYYQQMEIDATIGHPPCQGLTGMNANAGPDNPKNRWTVDFAKTSIAMNVRWAVFENIPRMVNLGRPIIDEVRRLGRNAGYELTVHRHNGALMGLPQRRRRVMFVLEREDSRIAWTPHMHLPEVTVWDAIGDLESVQPTEGYDDILKYVDEPHNAYQELMREGSDAVHNHRAFTIPERWSSLREGQHWYQLPREHLSESEIRRIEDNSLFNSIEPIRIFKDRPSGVLTGAFNMIHPTQARKLTVREGSRLMGFPDRWIWPTSGNMQQIAAGVSPLIGRYFAEALQNRSNDALLSW